MDKLSYLAGIIDGEGHFYKSRSGNHYYPRIVVEQKEKALIDWLKNNYGGNVTFQHRPNGNEIYRWVLQSKQAIELANKIKHLLIVKKSQVYRIL
jgi:hypothetical protein